MAKRVRMLGLFGVLAGAALATALPAQPALAWPAAYEGQPAPFQPGADAGFYIWHDGIGNHLATTGPGPAHHFQATISTDGQFERSDGAALEGADRFDLSADGHTITVDFTTLSRVDRIRWRDVGGTNMTFQLMMDGQPIDEQHIYVGADGRHPLDAHFCLFQ